MGSCWWGDSEVGGEASTEGCTKSFVGPSEKRKRGNSFQVVCSETLVHSLSSFCNTSSLPLITNHHSTGLSPLVASLYLRLTRSSSCLTVVSLASVEDTTEGVVDLRAPHIFLAPSTFSFCPGLLFPLLSPNWGCGVSAVSCLLVSELGVPLGLLALGGLPLGFGCLLWVYGKCVVGVW